MASPLRTAAPFRHGLQYLPLKRSRKLATPWILHSMASNVSCNCRGIVICPSTLKTNYFRPTAITTQHQHQLRAYSPSTSANAPTADNLVEELQGLYVTAKDLFATAAESTKNETTYAASDRESLHDALNQLVTAYELYTTGEISAERSGGDGGDGATKAGTPGPIVRPNFDAGSIPDTVMGDVRERFGQKVLELRNAIELLEEKARDD
ncbi:hypothetical protein N7524_001252 [Penicillium chrysogenum]|nr:hypothetical protein N7524_001252 [Penicillium chrysogenum]